ncbi:hypothetical protein V8D89_001555 [Ganoderma adspersum]
MTVATNAPLERKGNTHSRSLVMRGSRDLLRIGNQAYSYIFDLDIRPPAPLLRSISGPPSSGSAGGGASGAV